MSENPSQPDKSLDDARAEVQWINHLLDTKPNDPRLWFHKATSFDHAMSTAIPERMRLERSLLWYTQCLGEWELQWAANYNIGTVLRRLNRHEEALPYAEEALRLNPTGKECKDLLEMTRVRLGTLDDAIAASKGQGGGAILRSVDTESDPTSTRGIIKDIYAKPETAMEALLAGQIPFVMEMADPELASLQFDADALIDVELAGLAEDLCIQYQILNGHNNVVDSILIRIRLMAREGPSKLAHDPHLLASVPAKAMLHPDASLLDLLPAKLPFELREVVQAVVEVPSLYDAFTADEINRSDDRIRWLLDTIRDFTLDIRDLKAMFTPIPPHVRRCEAKAMLNFMIARRKRCPTGIAYTAATLATFYEHFQGSHLPYVLYSIAATESAKALQPDYCVFAHGRCALILMREQRFGLAISHLLQAMGFVKSCQRVENAFELFTTLSECYTQLGLFNQALKYAQKAADLEQLPEQLKEQAELGLMGLKAVAKGAVRSVGMPPLVVKGLSVNQLVFKGPEGDIVFQYTSRHELYDSLVQYHDGMMQMGQTLVEREIILTFLRKMSRVADLTVAIALELDLPFNALLHLETYKAVLLRKRLKYLPIAKPEGVPEDMWTRLQKLIEMYRSVTEEPHGSGSPSYVAANCTPEQILDQVRHLQWKTSLFSNTRTSPILQRLALGDVPQSISCSMPANTVVLTFVCGPEKGYCLFVSPGDCRAPVVVELPRASIPMCELLSERFAGVLNRFLMSLDHQQGVVVGADDFEEFAKEFDDVFYLPLRRLLHGGRYLRICVIEDRRMRSLPVNLLGYGCGDGPLCLRYDLSFSPSLSVLAALSARPAVRSKSALIVADSVPECPHVFCDNSKRDCFGLQGSKAEADYLAGFLTNKGLRSNVLAGGAATCAAVTESVTGVQLIHLGCHGFFFPDAVESSGVLLARDPRERISDGVYVDHEGNLTVQEELAVGQILTLRHAWQQLDMTDCALLNLAGCSTGLVDRKEQADEFYGLANGFLYAGTHSVIGAVWPVLDLLAMVFNRFFYDAFLCNDTTPTAALRMAMDSFRCLEPHDFVRLVGVMQREPGDMGCSAEDVIRLIEAIGSVPTASNRLSHPLLWGSYKVTGRLD